MLSSKFFGGNFEHSTNTINLPLLSIRRSRFFQQTTVKPEKNGHVFQLEEAWQRNGKIQAAAIRNVDRSFRYCHRIKSSTLLSLSLFSALFLMFYIIYYIRKRVFSSAVSEEKWERRELTNQARKTNCLEMILFSLHSLLTYLVSSRDLYEPS